MILDLFDSYTYILNVLASYKDFALKANLSLEVLNTYNNPLMQDIKLTLKNPKTSNLLVINFNYFNHLRPRELRSGLSGCIDTNEYNLVFTLYFMSMEAKDKTSFKSSLLVYELWNKFLYETRFSFHEDREENTEVIINIFINQLNEGKLECPKKINQAVNSTVGNNTFSTSATFNSSFSVNLREKGGQYATEYDQC